MGPPERGARNSERGTEIQRRPMNETRKIPLIGSDSGVEKSSSEFRAPSSALVDSFGRVHNNLRISVTDRCNLRCTYCMPEEVVFMDRRELLTFEEIRRFVEIAAPLGIDKIRLTGGEPLMRRDLPRLVGMLCAIPGI